MSLGVVDATVVDAPECWADVPGWEGYYQASTHGRVRSVDRVVPSSRGQRRLRGKVLRPGTIRGGYRHIMLQRTGHKPRIMLVHRCVLMAFAGMPPGGHEACHNDGNPANNVLSNLRWDTPTANAEDRRRHGTMWSCRGSENPSAKLTEDDVHEIDRGRARGETLASLAKRLGVSATAVSDADRRKTWSHLPKWGEP